MRLRSARRALILLAVLAVVLLLGKRFLTLYTGPWASFVRPTRAYLAAAAAHDSTRLRELGACDSLVQRTLAAASERPEQVALDHLRLISGRRSGDTTRVIFLHTSCSGNMLVLTFRGSGSNARVQDISLPCSSPHHR